MTVTAQLEKVSQEEPLQKRAATGGGGGGGDISAFRAWPEILENVLAEIEGNTLSHLYTESHVCFHILSD